MRGFLTFTLAAVVAGGASWAVAQSTPQKAAAPATTVQQPPKPARVSTPPIPNPGFSPGRPVDQTRAVYDFAAQHPEVLKFVPCYCGCESSGHPHNESCFVKRRDARGNVTEWDTHGYG